MFFNLREVPGLKKKPSTSELLDWLKLLLAEDIPPEALQEQRQEGADPAAARRAAQERAGRAPVRARRVHGAQRALGAAAMAFIEPVTLDGAHATLEPLAREHEAGAQGRGGRRRAVAALVHERSGAGQDGGVDRRRRSRCARAWARCRSSCATTRPATIVGMHALLQRRRREPAARDRPHLVREARAAHGDQHRVQAPAADARVRDARTASPSSSARTSSTSPSRAAIARLGAKQDGILRNHQILPDGTLRDTVVFSIIAQRMAGGEAATSLWRMTRPRT